MPRMQRNAWLKRVMATLSCGDVMRFKSIAIRCGVTDKIKYLCVHLAISSLVRRGRVKKVSHGCYKIV